MKFIITNDIKVINPTYELISYCQKNLVLINPEYAKKERLGFYIRDTPKTLHLFWINDNVYHLPFGCWKDLWEQKIWPSDTETRFAPLQATQFEGDIVLYPNQEKALKALINAKNGILEAPCGSGKTQIGLALIKKIGVKALWLTHTEKLLKQSIDRAVQYFKGDLGTITKGKIKIGRDITFATVQTMANIDPQVYKNAFNMVIVDECHHCAGTPTKVMQFYKIVNNLNCRYKYGMSATLSRQDGLIKSVFSLLGKIVYTMERSPEQALLAQHTPIFLDIEYNMEDYLNEDGTFNYTKLITALSESKERNEIIISTAKKYENRKQLILCDRVSHAVLLAEKLGAILMVGQKTNYINPQNSNIIVATYALAKEGLDFPFLDLLQITTPIKDYTRVIQCVGRVERYLANKPTPIIIDYVDKNIPYCANAFMMRKRILKNRNK